MRKKTKIILIVISSIVLLIGVLLFLIFKTNLFLDTSDLVCSRVYFENETMKQEDYIELYFNDWAIVKGGKKESHITYYDETLLQQSYEALKDGFEQDDAIELKDNTIIVNTEIELALNQEGMNRKKIKETYKEYGYECK